MAGCGAGYFPFARAVVIYSMADNSANIPPDIRLIGGAVNELIISRRNISIYPRSHPSVDKSLERASGFMLKLFEMRPDITIAVAKDTLIVDDCYLEKKHPAFRELALLLNSMSIAYVTFAAGLTKDEIYAFHLFISSKVSGEPSEELKEKFEALNLTHIRAGFIDYGAFGLAEGASQPAAADASIWERYVFGLLDGTLQAGDVAGGVREIPPDVLARIINKSAAPECGEESCERVVAAYGALPPERGFSGKDLRRLLDFINALRPEVKRQFISSAVRSISRDLDAAYRSLRGISINEIMDLKASINEQDIVVPSALKNLLDSLLRLRWDGTATPFFNGGLLVDDIHVSGGVVNLLKNGRHGKLADSTYGGEIQKLSDYQPETIAGAGEIWERECSNEAVNRSFNQTILDILQSDIASEEEYRSFLKLIREQCEQFLWTGQYLRILDILKALSSGAEGKRFPGSAARAIGEYYTDEFISSLIDSFRVMGRQMRDEAWRLCDYYGERLISPLLDALISEESQVNRSFFISILKQYGGGIVPEALKKLGDSRWYVKRNMLFILSDCTTQETAPHIRPYCRHENRKVRLEAVKCLLNAGDAHGIQALRDYFHSESGESAEEWISLAGAYRIKEVVPDLIALLKKRGLTGYDWRRKIPVVRALGEIADPRALGPIRDLLGGRSIFSRESAEKFREEVYRTLKKYPPGLTKEFIISGLKSGNTFIREESMRLGRKEE